MEDRIIRGYDLPVYLYHLSDPLTKNIHYVGITHNPIMRYSGHINGFSDWIATLLSSNLKPIMTMFDFYEKRATGLISERYVISQAIKDGFPLNNLSRNSPRRPISTQLSSYDKFIESTIKRDNLKMQDNLVFLPPLAYCPAGRTERDVIFKVYLKPSEIAVMEEKAKQMGISTQDLIRMFSNSI
jgi:hypothetical protein